MLKDNWTNLLAIHASKICSNPSFALVVRAVYINAIFICKWDDAFV